MAELAASLIGIIEAGTKVAFLLSTLASNIGSAGKEAQVVAREIRSFCSIMRSLSQAIDQINDGEYSSRCAELISEMTAVSQQMFTEILDLVENLRSVSDLAKTKFNLAGRIKWVLNKPKITFLRTALETYKADLSLMLGSIHVAQGVNSQLYERNFSNKIASDHIPRQSGEKAREPTSRNQSLEEQQKADRQSRLLETLALDYQASLVELEDAHHAVDDSELTPDIEADPLTRDEKRGTPVIAQIPGMVSMIHALRSEVHSLSSATSSIYSTNTTSIYSSISRQSSRLSQLIENLPLDKIPVLQDIKRTSMALNSQGDAFPKKGVMPPVRSSVMHIQRDASFRETIGHGSTWRRVANARLKEMEWFRWTGVNSTDALSIISRFVYCHEKLTTICSKVSDEESQDYARLFTLICKDLAEIGQKSQEQYLTYIQERVTIQSSVPTIPLPAIPEAAVEPSLPPPDPYPSSSPVNGKDPARKIIGLEPSSSSNMEASVTILKGFRVAMDAPCRTVLPAALRKYEIDAPWQDYHLYIVYDDIERFIGLDEKPLILFKQLDKEGKKPMFMLRKATFTNGYVL